MDLKRILAKNLEELMKRPGPEGRSSWSVRDVEAETKKRGKAVGKTTVSRLLAPEDPAYSFPKIDTVESLAKAFRLSDAALLLLPGMAQPKADLSTDAQRLARTFDRFTRDADQQLMERAVTRALFAIEEVLAEADRERQPTGKPSPHR